jgi:signal transduction histidine kinase
MASITIQQAAELLERLRLAAPAATAIRIEQIMALVDELSQENAYLNALIPDTEMPAPAPSDEPISENDNEFPVEAYIAGNSTATDLLVGMNDALRAPLVAIRGRAELIQAGFLGKITDEQNQWLSAIHESTGRAFAVLDAVQQLLDLHRSQVRIDWGRFIAMDLIEEAYERVKDRADARGHTMMIVTPEVVPMAMGDFYQSLIVLTDILDNAVRYTPPNENGQIRLSVDNLGTHVLFNVADNGIGLNEADLEHIGQPFWRGEHHKLVRQHPGTGLRLFLARRILALQQGDLIYSGELEVGSTFSFTLMIPS